MLLLLCASVASAAHLLGFNGVPLNEGTQIAYEMFNINTESGEFSPLLQTFVINSRDYLAEAGISCYNRRSKTLYWSDDIQTTYVYAVLPETNSILAMFDTGYNIEAIDALACNQANGDFWVVGLASHGTSSTTSTGTASVLLTQFHQNWKQGIVIPLTVEGLAVAVEGTSLYLLGATPAPTTTTTAPSLSRLSRLRLPTTESTTTTSPTTNPLQNATFSVWTYDTVTGATVAVQNLTCAAVFFTATFVSPTSLRGCAWSDSSAQLSYVYEIDPTSGACDLIPLNLTLVMPCTYNPSTQEMYAIDDGQPTLLLTYSYLTGESSVVPIPQLPLNIEFYRPQLN